MGGPGLPFLIPLVPDAVRRRRGTSAPPYTPEEDYELPIIPYPDERRAMTLNEIGDAGVVPKGKPSFTDRLMGALANAGRSGALDPNNESGGVGGFIESLLGTALGTYAGGRDRAEAENESDLDLNAEIVGNEQARRRQAQQDELDDELRRMQIGSAEASTRLSNARTYREMFPAESTSSRPAIDIEALADAWDDRGFPDKADFIRRNPAIVERNPSAYSRIPDEVPLDPDDEDAIERADAADAAGARELLMFERSGYGGFTTDETARQDRLGRYRRTLDPTYTADSTTRARVTGRGATAARSTFEDELGLEQEDSVQAAIQSLQAANPRTTVTPSRGRTTTRGRTEQAVAASRGQQSNVTGQGGAAGTGAASDLTDLSTALTTAGAPNRIPIARALSILADSTVQPPLSDRDKRAVLKAAGYKTEDINLVLQTRQGLRGTTDTSRT